MNKLLNCMIVDDDELSRLVLKKLIEKTEGLQLTHEVSDPIQAMNLLVEESANEIDIVFLDIEMPKLSGLDIMNALNESYNVIFVAGNKDHAVEAVSTQAIDYLVKPVDYDKFLNAIRNLQTKLKQEQVLAENQSHLFVKSSRQLIRINFDKILYVEAMADYVIFFLENEKKHIVHHTMKGIEKRLPASIFTRIQRSYIINRDKVISIKDTQVKIGDKVISTGNNYRNNLLEQFNIL